MSTNITHVHDTTLQLRRLATRTCDVPGPRKRGYVRRCGPRRLAPWNRRCSKTFFVFLQKEELVLKALRATDLKACLRTGTGTRGYEANAERAKYYRIYNKIEKQVTADQKATLMDWERRLCSEAEDIDFARLLTILENRQDDLRQMQKNKSRSMFQQQPEQYRQGLEFLPKFLEAQKKQYDR